MFVRRLIHSLLHSFAFRLAGSRKLVSLCFVVFDSLTEELDVVSLVRYELIIVVVA
eukprot:GDKH01022662.1.p1 GENE.GDKH01022662.1~~GDKH01022662.1.p1  ORF type:complete len:56 (+),score=6.44 GDKH01022662.1:59-226(+)